MFTSLHWTSLNLSQLEKPALHINAGLQARRHSFICVKPWISLSQCKTVQLLNSCNVHSRFSTACDGEQWRTMQYIGIQNSTEHFNIVERSAVKSNRVQCSAVKCRAVQSGAVQPVREHLLSTLPPRLTIHCSCHCSAINTLCTALHCTVLHCTALHCTALHCTALHCTTLDEL